jgi:signal transduction histidine kinase/CHASE3 domain sensor protein/ActR/RegA family two-component response regulator
VSKALVRNAHTFALIGVALLIGVVAFLVWSQFNGTRQAWFWVQHTYDVMIATDQLGMSMRDAESSQRAYLLTGQDDDLEQYRAAFERVALLQGELRRLTADNSAQQDRLRELAPLFRRQQEAMDRAIQLRRDVGLGAALSAMPLRRDLFRQIESGLSGVAGEEQRLLELRRQWADRAELLARWLAVGGSILAVALFALSGWLLAQSRRLLLLSEDEQRTLATQMRTAIESISQGIGVFDETGALMRWNDCFVALLSLPGPMVHRGIRYEAIVEQLAADRGSQLETMEQIRHHRSAKTLGEPIVYEHTRQVDNRSFELRRTFMPNGGFVLTVSDITERVRAEVTARDAQRLQAMGQLTGGIAHDFNNLLTVVMANLELAKSRLPVDSDAGARIERAMWGANRGAALTQQLLAFARKQTLMPVPIDLSAMLPDMASLLRRTLGEHINVRTVDAAGLWPALADPAQVESALLNLSLNARDAMPGGGRLTIELANKVLDADYARQHVEVTPGDYVMLAVSDTGTGMPSDILARAFEPFFTTKDEGRGTGLGLAMVHGFVKQSGGHVNIYSEVGEGTTVRLYLPRAVGAVLPASRSAAPADLPRGNATILVVEDEAAVREACVAILRDLGYRVLEAADGLEALRVFGENEGKVDLLLTDVVLTGRMKGNDVASRLKEVRPDLRVLFMSGYTENAIVHHGRLDDGVHLIGKPFHREQIARKVSEVLGEAGTITAASQEPNVIDLASRGGRAS